MEQILLQYYKDNANKLHKMVDKILKRLHFKGVDNTDFYSLANEVFANAMRNYDHSQSFDGFLYSCLYKKFCTEMTSRTRDKRCVKIKIKEKNQNGKELIKIKIVSDIYLDAPINDDRNSTIGDFIADDFTVEKELFEKEEREEWREEIKEFFNSLSPLQRKIAFLLSYDNTPDEICEELDISIKHFENSMKRILADEKIRTLRPLVERM